MANLTKLYADLYDHIVKAPARLLALVQPDPSYAAFSKAVSNVLSAIHTAWQAAEDANNLAEADRLKPLLMRLYFWALYADDQLVAAVDNSADVNAAMTSLRTATAALVKTSTDFDTDPNSVGAASDSLDALQKALKAKN